MNVLLRDASHVARGHCRNAGWQVLVIIERKIVNEQIAHRVRSLLGRFEAAGKGLRESPAGKFQFLVSRGAAADSFHLLKQFLDGRAGNICTDSSTCGKASRRALINEKGESAIRVAVFLAQVHIDAAGEESAQNVVHHFDGHVVRGRSGYAQRPDQQKGLGSAWLIDDVDSS